MSFDDLTAMKTRLMMDFPIFRERFYILTHPDNLNTLRPYFRDAAEADPNWRDLLGLEIRASPQVDRFVKRWEFPKERYWIYEPKDESWCRFFNIGREVETTQPAFWKVVDRPRPFIQTLTGF